MRPPAFASDGRWFRGNLHTHSDRSDGVVPPERVLAEYRAAGYDFLVLTDHFEAGAYNVLLHPGLTNLLDFDRLPVEHLHAVETFNQNAAVSWPDQAEARYAADALLARGHRLHVTVGDDSHWHHPWDRFAAWVEVRARRLDPDALLTALKAGAYYSTQAPRIHDVSVEDDRVHVACSAVRAVALTGIHGWRSDVAIGESLEEATLDLGKLRSPYWRVTVTDAQGRRAWTNPVWV